MSEKPTNGAGEAEPVEEEIPVEVEVEVEVEGEASETDEATDVAETAEAADSGAADASGFDSDDWASMVGQLEQEKTELEGKVEALEQEKKQTHERMLRAVADADNARKRARKDVEESRIDARSRTLREILPVIDNLERAVQHAEQTADAGSAGVAGVIEGVKLVLRQFEQALERCEVRGVEAKGQPFDPNVHEAISQQETDEVAPGSVVDVLQRGYKIGERLLRPALVVVARAPAPAPTPAPPADEEETEKETDEEAAPEGDEGDEGEIEESSGNGAAPTEAADEAADEDTDDDKGG